MATTTGSTRFGEAELEILQGYSALFLTENELKMFKLNLMRVDTASHHRTLVRPDKSKNE